MTDPDGSVLSQRLEAIARDTGLTDGVKKELIAALSAQAEAKAGREAEQTRFAAQHRRGRWSTPLAVALTGLITLSGNFAFYYWRADQAAVHQSAQADQDAANARQIAQANAEAERRLQRDKFEAEQNQAALSFQYEVIKSELAKRESPEARANALRFLVRVGILGEPLILSEIDTIIAEVQGGDADALPPVGGAGTEYSHDYSPCKDTRFIDRAGPMMVDRMRKVGGLDGIAISPDAPAWIAALRDVLADNGVCAPDQIGMVFAIAAIETSGFSRFEVTAEQARDIFERFYEGREGLASELYPEDGAVEKFRNRGLNMVFGRPNYEFLATALQRPELLDDPDLLARDPELSARAVVATYRRLGLFSRCPPGNCDVDHILRRTLGTTAMSGRVQDMIAAATRYLEEAQ
ncbi:hypothetical protein RGUI_0399 [Rhodovulum sp. P5]|uniref:hypothetical protein n=1 Tax=Rhodovulum sp. P5 TaxID=1564506 RepID=UPI0009C2CB72|nr:hypothetical protein [Rhodovulum sp. P5]ARE38540.1 hypothetical protein RGUI_0399 [Rhodovulum sp. P5]